MKRILLISAIVACLAIGTFGQIYLALHENQTLDEGVHLSVGYSYLQTGDFRLNREHPPLAKMLAAAPLLFVQPHLPLENDSWKKADQWEFARDFLYKAGNNADQILFLGRLPMIFLTLLMGILIARWSYEIAGLKGSLFSTGWFVASPLFLAHGHLITTDIPLALGVLASLYFFTKWAQKPSIKWLVMTALSVAFASEVKFTGLTLVAIIPLFAFICRKFFYNRYPLLTKKLVRQLLLSILCITFLAILVFSLDITLRMQDDPFQGQPRIQQLIGWSSTTHGVIQLAVKASLVIAKHVPIPGYPYVDGLILFLGHDIGGHETFFMGDFSNTGSTFFFPVAFVIKSPLAFVICITLLFLVLVKRFFSLFHSSAAATHLKERIKFIASKGSAQSLALIGFPIIYLLIAMTSHVNIGVRHIAPMFPPLFVALSGLLIVFEPKIQKMFSFVCWTLFSVGLISVVTTLPYPIAYFSEIVGGAENGRYYMLDSNLDWGQNLKYLKKYLVSQQIDHVCMAYFGQGDLSYEGIDYRYLPKNDELEGIRNLDCMVAISVQSLYWQKSDYAWLMPYTPSKIIGRGIYLYDLRKPSR